jgi:hypothetical protein
MYRDHLLDIISQHADVINAHADGLGEVADGIREIDSALQDVGGGFRVRALTAKVDALAGTVDAPRGRLDQAAFVEDSAMARLFISKRFGPWRAGVSLGPEDFRQRRRRGRPPKALASPTSGERPVSFYGVALDQPDPSAELPRARQSIGRSLWTIVGLLLWLAFRAVLLLAFVAIAAVAGLVLIMK